MCSEALHRASPWVSYTPRCRGVLPYAERTNFHKPLAGAVFVDCCERRTTEDVDGCDESEDGKADGRQQIALHAVAIGPTFHLIGMLHRAVCTRHDLFLEPVHALALQKSAIGSHVACIV